jgi:hypothetical protein
MFRGGPRCNPCDNMNGYNMLCLLLTNEQRDTRLVGLVSLTGLGRRMKEKQLPRLQSEGKSR